MHGENSPTEYLSLAKQIVDLIAANEDAILKDYQTSLCSGCTGAKFVYRSPAAYKVAQVLAVMKKRGYTDDPTRN